jgi:beta-galactosidase
MNIEKIKSMAVFIFLFFIYISVANLLWADIGHAAVRGKLDFNENWKFELGDSADYSLPSFDDENWRKLNLPHDWSIEGEFDESNPAGISGGALPGGIGWYRKTFFLNGSDKAKKVYITFDGVYHNSEVYLNGELLGKRPNGYISFQYDLTPHLKYGASANVLAVRVDNSDQPNSRWYSGSGIYRHVWLEKVNPVHIDLWGTHVTTPQVSETSAAVQIDTVINNTTSINKQVELETLILNASGTVINKQVGMLSIDKESTEEISQTISVPSPTLWSIENPYLYKVVSVVKMHHRIIDEYETPFGIRYFRFDADKGFFLNGKAVKIKGVCNHHDLGALGAALNTRAKERQLEILKAMGCNSIRTSHNPPSPELLQLCDQMGFIVQNESFDVWAMKKVEYDYAKDWDQWHEQDLKDHLLRDRNHPCIFMWSIGNEILEQWDTPGEAIALELPWIWSGLIIIMNYLKNFPGNFQEKNSSPRRPHRH